MAETATAGGGVALSHERHRAGLPMAVAGLVGIIGFLAVALARVSYPYELAYFEGSTVEVSARLVEGQSVYGPPSPEFTPWPYPPMYFWLTAGAAEVFGLSLPTMRWVSLAASIVVLGLIALVVHRLTASRWAALLGAGLYAGTFRVAGAWADTARVDSVFLAWVMAGVAVAITARTWRTGALTGVLFAAAFLTKQNALIVAVPILLMMLIRRRQAGIAATVTTLAGAVGSVVLGDLMTGGWYSPYVVTQLLGHPVASRWFAWFWFVDVFLPFILLTTAAGWIAWRAGRAAPRAHVRGITDERMVFGGTVVGLLLAGWAGRLHEGGSSNVAMPTHVALSMLLAVAVRGLITSPRVSRREVGVLGGVVVAQMLVLLMWRSDLVPTARDRAAGDRFIGELASAPGSVVVASHPYYARLAGHRPVASAIAVADLLKSRSGRARDSLAAQQPWPLTGVGTVVADSLANAASLGPELVAQFSLVDSDLIPGDDFLPVTDYPTKPTLVYVRTSELDR